MINNKHNHFDTANVTYFILLYYSNFYEKKFPLFWQKYKICCLYIVCIKSLNNTLKKLLNNYDFHHLLFFYLILAGIYTIKTSIH